MKFKHILFSVILLMTTQAFAQITGKFGTYYDQRELLFESLPTSENDIIFLGNSITDGGEWAELFQNPNCKNRGISADITAGVLNRLETITQSHPAMVFLMIGTNDMNWGVSNDTIAMSIREIVQRIKRESPRTRIVVESILPVNDCYGYFSGHTKRYADVPIINGMLKAMAEEEGVTYLDLYSRFANEEGKMDPKYSNDGLHINGDGYQLWKEVVDEEIGMLSEPARNNRLEPPLIEAQEFQSQEPQLYDPWQNKVPIWLDFSAGANLAECYDKGTVPFRYKGFGANATAGVTVEWGRCHVQAEGRGLYSELGSPSGTAYDVDLSTEFLYHLSRINRLSFWTGGTLHGFMDIRDIPLLQNAATSYSFFGNFCATGMMQYDFAINREKTHPWLTAYGKLSLLLVGVVSRPSYAYIGNPTINDIALFSENETFAKFFPGASTELGLYLNLLNANRIGLSYRWDYLTTGKKGAYRYDNALHAINLSFMFRIN